MMMRTQKGIESIATLIPWLLLAVIFIALVIFFVTNRFESIKELIARIFPTPV